MIPISAPWPKAKDFFCLWVSWADVVVFVGDADIVGGCWR
jgi:hypothetical protein